MANLIGRNVAQIDSVLDRADGVINLCEMKFCNVCIVDVVSLAREGAYGPRLSSCGDGSILANAGRYAQP